MAAINVYRYDYYDPVLKRERRSVDYATGDAIMALGGTILSETYQMVEEELLEDDGTIRAIHVFAETPPVPVPVRTPRAGTRRAV